MTGSAFENESTNPADLSGLLNLALLFEGGSNDIDLFEVAGEDMGAMMIGFESNFALGVLQLGGDAGVGQVRLVDLFDNQPGWEGDEALYVESLIISPGGSLNLNGLKLYCRLFDNDAGTVTGGDIMIVTAIPGDANEDGTVDLQDFGILKANFGGPGGWGEGDFNDDGVIDLQDFGLLKANFGAGEASVPEPATLSLLLLGAAVIIRRRT